MNASAALETSQLPDMRETPTEYSQRRRKDDAYDRDDYGVRGCDAKGVEEAVR